MGGVKTAANYQKVVNIGPGDGTVTNGTKQGGLVAVYCESRSVVCLMIDCLSQDRSWCSLVRSCHHTTRYWLQLIDNSGCFLGGFLSDRFGQIKIVFIGSLWALLGGALQAGSINDKMFICARVIAGAGVGHLNGIIPVWSAEIASGHARGGCQSAIPSSAVADR